MAMSISKKIEFLWNKALEDAMGAGEADPFAYASSKVARMSAQLRAVERAQQYAGNGHPRVGSRAGRRQAAES
ncbi:MAG: hypothetical protein HXX10_07515 [Rhodoplanes sp.]|uniref:hypothetical protein n=1 Tax=Rhodoplanes sp. TaxID=1968906 RepID=UPI0017FDC214|nr:hypothetical protein [Rhodoplanes sp.]NVO13868.1 hypothetical protein [Rhodoplanes sp.]